MTQLPPNSSSESLSNSSLNSSSNSKIPPRDVNHKMIAGVCSGLAHYFHVDMWVPRVAFIFLTIFTYGFGILFYIAALFIMPVPGQSSPLEDMRARNGAHNSTSSDPE